MPMFKIYVGNLDARVKIEHVRELFAPFATIEDAVLAVDAETSKPKGFAIVMIRDPEIGRAAVKATQGKRLMGKTLTINEVMKKGKAAAKSVKEARQGPFGPHFNRQGGPRAGARGGARRGLNRSSRPTSGDVGAPGSRAPSTGDLQAARGAMPPLTASHPSASPPSASTPSASTPSARTPSAPMGSGGPSGGPVAGSSGRTRERVSDAGSTSSPRSTHARALPPGPAAAADAPGMAPEPTSAHVQDPPPEKPKRLASKRSVERRPEGS